MLDKTPLKKKRPPQSLKKIFYKHELSRLQEKITNALLDVGIEGSTIHAAMGVGIRERLGALGVAVDAEREVVSVMVSSDEVDRIFNSEMQCIIPFFIYSIWQ